MHVEHLVITSVSCPSPTRADAQRIQDWLWAHAPHALGIEHICVRARQGHIDIVLFTRSSIHGEYPGKRVALAAIRDLPPLRTWQVTLADN